MSSSTESSTPSSGQAKEAPATSGVQFSQAAGDVTIGGDVVGRDKVVYNITHLIQGLGDLPTRYDGPVRNFLEYYLGTPGRPAPFGGRQADLARLHAWFNDPNAPPYALLAAPAGRGKSSLLAHWVAALEGRADLSVVFFPISIRYSTNRETVVFAALYARLAHLYGETATRAAEASEYRSVVVDYLRRPPPNGRRLLVVIDALDEAASWEMGADVFPADPPAHLRVLLSARYRAGDADGRGWLAQLGWERPGRAALFSLAGLDRAGVADTLVQMGNPLDQLAAKFDVVTRLHDLSEGDPLLVRLYVEALLPQQDQAQLFTPADLLTLDPGLDSYLSRWWDEQRKLWGAENPLKEGATKAFINVCATAFGPLTKTDILWLASDEIGDSWTLAEAARALSRLLIGDGETVGYVFSHPRLRDYFARQLTKKERQVWQGHFLAYGQETLTGLANKTREPKDAPEYVVKYYSTHLTTTQASPAKYYALMCEGWLRAWEWVDGTPDGFLGDARRAWTQAEAEGPAALGQIVRAALCFSSVASVSAQISAELFIACLQAGVLNPRLALVLARAMPTRSNRCACLLGLGERLSGEEQRAVLAEALAVARAIGGPDARASALGAVAEKLPPPEQRLVLAEALAAARAVEDDLGRAAALDSLVVKLTPEEQLDVLAEALAVARRIEAEGSRVELLRSVAEKLPPEATNLLAELLAAARAVGSGYGRAAALSAVIEKVPPEERSTVLAEALAAARAAGNPYGRALALSLVAMKLPPEERSLIVAEALTAARDVDAERWRMIALSAVAEQLPPDAQSPVFAEALADAHTIGYDLDRAMALGAIADKLSPEATNLLAETLAAARAISGEWSRSFALSDVAKKLPPAATSLLVDTLAAARAISDDQSQVRVLSVVAKKLPPDERRTVLSEALAAARAVGDEKERANALTAMAARLPPNERASVLAEAVAAARAVSLEWERPLALSAVAENLPPPEQAAILAEALAAARAISGGQERVDALSAIAEKLPPDLQRAVLADAFATARSLGDQRRRAAALRALAEKLPTENTDLVAETLAVIRAVDDDFGRATALSAVAEKCSAEEWRTVFAEALAVARQIDLDGDLALALRAVAPRVPPGAADLLTETLSAAQTVADELGRGLALRAVAERVPPGAAGLLAEALSAARAVGDEWGRASALSAVATKLPPEERSVIWAEALAAARAVDDEQGRAYALSAVVETLPPDASDLLVGILDTVRALSGEQWRAEALRAVAKKLPVQAAELQHEALQMVYPLADTSAGPDILKQLAPHWTDICASEFGELSVALRAYASARRPNLLQALEALLPIIARLGGERAIGETTQAIIDTAKWWP